MPRIPQTMPGAWSTSKPASPMALAEKKGRPRKRPPFLRLRTALGVPVQAEQDKRLAGMQAQ